MNDWTVDTLLDEMSARGDRPAVVAFTDVGRESRSYEALAADSRKLAAGLRAAGLEAGERVLLLGPNGIDWITVYLGALAAGLVVVPLDNLAQATEIGAVVAAAEPAIAFVGRDHVDTVRPLLPGGRCRALDRAGASDMPGWDGLIAEDRTDGTCTGGRPGDPDATALLLQTSGTTGAAKLFTLRQRQLGANVTPLAESGLARPSDRLLMPLPMHHVYPQVVGILTAFQVGATIVLPAAITAASLLAALHEERATGIIGVPRLYETLVGGIDDAIRSRSAIAHRVFEIVLSASGALRRLGLNVGRVLFGAVRGRLSPDLRLVVSGGARLDPAVAARLAGLGFDVRTGYGLAETSSTHTANFEGAARLGTEGKPFPGGEVRIDAPDETGTGEILLRGPNVFDGYLDPEKTRDSFTPDGWFRTGDLGRLDDDGFLTVTGRVKETIVLGGGKKVNPEDLEKVYAEHPFIAEIGILESDGRLAALIRPDREEMAKGGLVRAEGPIRIALADAARSLASHMQLSGFAIVRDPLPRTRLGKLRRFLLPEIYRTARSGGAPAPGRQKTAVRDPLLDRPKPAAAWRLLQERYGERVTSIDDYLALDLGIDSLEWVGLTLALEELSGIDLQGATLAEIGTVRALLEAVDRAPAGGGGPPAESAVEAWTGAVPAWQRGVARALTGLNRALFRTLFRLRVDGLEHLPASGPYTVACNHLSYLDALAIAAALPPRILRRTHWGAAERTLPGERRLRWLYMALNVFPLEEAAPAVGMACARRALDAGENLVVFPEAWRSPDGKLQPFLPGLGHLLAGTDIAIVPSRIRGTFEAWPRHRRWPRLAPVRVSFAPARSPSELESRGRGDTPAERLVDGLYGIMQALD